jgi:hypothetical protein
MPPLDDQFHHGFATYVSNRNEVQLAIDQQIVSDAHGD